jgi:hypothetical protein
VYHIRIIAPEKKWLTRHETDRFLNNHCQECVRAYLSIHDCLSFLHDRQSSEQNDRKLISYHVQICHWGNKKKINMAFHFVRFARINILDQTLNWD